MDKVGYFLFGFVLGYFILRPIISMLVITIGTSYYKRKERKKNSINTHKVIDIIHGTDDALFYGSESACYEWKREQGFGYRVVTLSKEELLIAN